VRTSLLESIIALMDFQAARWLVDGVCPGQEGNNHPTIAPMGVFPAADGLFNLAPPVVRCSASSALRSGGRLPERPEFADLRSGRKSRRAQRVDRRCNPQAHGRRVDRDPQRGRHPVRPDPYGQRDVERRSGAPSSNWHRPSIIPTSTRSRSSGSR
jgi:hypothetical protein